MLCGVGSYSWKEPWCNWHTTGKWYRAKL